MRTTMIFCLVLVLLVPAMANAVTVSGESEIGIDEADTLHHSNFFYIKSEKSGDQSETKWLEGKFRYLRAGKKTERGEFAIGPTFRFGKHSLVKVQVGGTTDKQVMSANLLATRVAKRKLVWALVFRLETRDDRKDTVFQKGWFQLWPDGPLHLRADHLTAGTNTVFFKVGPEWRFGKGKVKGFVAGNYNLKSDDLGAFAGLRYRF